MRAKIPFYDGAFPSLWLTSRNTIGYNPLSTYSTEIDIFEVFGRGTFDLGELTSNNYQMVGCIHKWYNDEKGNKTNAECSCGTTSDKGNNYVVNESDRSKLFKSSSEREAWHDIVFEWTEDAMTFSVDGTAYYTAKRSEMEGKFGLTDLDKGADGIFEQFLCVRLNNHMHTYGGYYAYNGSGNIDVSKLNYEIDYIRLYQKNDGKSQINLK
jgi:beta-glucanase (GH16 family)